MPTIKIMPLGDSITVGSLVPGAYRAPLWDRLTADGVTTLFVGSQNTNPRQGMSSPKHEGHDSITAPGLTWGFQNQNWLAVAPNIVLLLIGTNDVGLGASFAQANTDLAWLLDLLITGRPSVKILVSTLLPRADDGEGWVKKYNATLPAVIAPRAAHATLVPLGAMLGLGDIDSGGIHPNQTGANKMAAGWQTAIRSLLMAVPPVTPPATTGTTWSPTDRSGTMTLDPTLLIATSVGDVAQSIRTTTPAPDGLWQVDVVATAITPTWALGIGTAAFPLGDGGGIGNDLFAIGYYPVDPKQSVWLNGGVTQQGLSFGPHNSVPDVTGATVGLVGNNDFLWITSDAMNKAFNPPAGKVVYNNNPAADPVAKTGGFPLSGLAAGPRFVIANTLDDGSVFTLKPVGPFKWPVTGAAPYGAAVVTPPPPTGPTHLTVAAEITTAQAAVAAAIQAADKALADAEAARLLAVAKAETDYAAALTAYNAAFASAETAFNAAMALALIDLAKLTP